MRFAYKISPAVLIVAGLGVVGCHHSETAPGVLTPSTMPAPESVATSAPPAAKDLTHVLSKDEPYFLAEPGTDSKPAGMLMAGSKVLVLIPGATYSQVITDKGVSAYVPTDGLNPIGK